MNQFQKLDNDVNQISDDELGAITGGMSKKQWLKVWNNFSNALSTIGGALEF